MLRDFLYRTQQQRSSSSRFALAVCAALACTAAQAVTIDFDDLASDDQQLFTQVVSGGFVFTNSAGGYDALGVWGRAESYQADPSGAAIFVNQPNSITTATPLENLPFDFESIDLADVLNVGDSVTVEFTFYGASGDVETTSVVLDADSGMQHFAFNRRGLRRVSWRTIAGANGWCQFDNFSAVALAPSAE